MKIIWWKFAFCFFAWIFAVYAMFDYMTFADGIIGSFAVICGALPVFLNDDKTHNA